MNLVKHPRRTVRRDRPGSEPQAVAIAVLFLLVALFAQLALTARRQSRTVDEGNHIYSGYMSWKHFDFGLNPEHPPLVKLLATLPLLRSQLNVPAPTNIYYKYDAYMGGKHVLLGNDHETILFRCRMAASLLTGLLALLVFLTAREMFGTGAGILALVLAVFDPNLLAHGALVTTDVGVSCFLLASVYAFYRYIKAPSLLRLGVVGLAAGFAWAAKHSGVFVFLMLSGLACSEFARWLARGGLAEAYAWKYPARLSVSLAIILLVAAAML
jgi:dolichyl-phosphate-mannose--protein O-mannosyl transferase